MKWICVSAIKLDGVNVRGYSEKFGLYAVDMSDPNRPRTPKASARFYHDVIKVFVT